MQIPFSKVDCTGNELNYVRDVFASGWLTTVGKTHAFEDRFRELVGARFACAVNSCTAGLHLALEALGGGAGRYGTGPDHDIYGICRGGPIPGCGPGFSKSVGDRS